MTRAQLGVFLLVDLAGVLWAVRLVARELPRQWAWLRRDREVGGRPMLQIPDDFVLVPGARRVPRPRSEPAVSRRRIG